MSLLHVLFLGILFSLDAHLPRPGYGGGLNFPQGGVPCPLLGLEGLVEGVRQGEGSGRRGEVENLIGNIYKVRKKFKK